MTMRYMGVHANIYSLEFCHRVLLVLMVNRILSQGTSGFDGQPSLAPGQPGVDRFIGELGNLGVGGIRCQPVCTTRCFR